MKTKKIPARICVGCREAKPKTELLRVLKDNEGRITMDDTGRKNGRGAYLCRNRTCLERALKSKGLERSLKMEIPPVVIESLKREMSLIETG